MKSNRDITNDDIRRWISDDNPPSHEDVLATGEALNGLANEYAVKPEDSVRAAILGKMATLNRQKKEQQKISLDNLPMLTAGSNWLEWKEAVKDIEPEEDFENIYMHPLEINDKYELYILWVKNYVDEEVHHDVIESFTLLEGSCECLITDKNGTKRTVRMREGDHLEMVLGEDHDISVTSGNMAKAILQWVKLAA